MDIRISSYKPVTVTSFGATGSTPASVTVQQANSPVEAVRATPAVNNNGAQDAIQLAPSSTQRQQAQAEGRGQIIDIYA